MDFVRSKFAQQTGQKVRKKVFNWQRFICIEVTSYKIHILTNLSRLGNFNILPLFSVTHINQYIKNYNKIKKPALKNVPSHEILFL